MSAGAQILVDDKLTWQAHVADVCRKARQSVGALWRARASLSSRVKWKFYFAFVQSKLSYASNAMFPSSSQSCLNSLLSVSRNAIRAFNNLLHTSSTLPVFDRLNIRPLDQFLACKCAVFVYRCLNSLSRVPYSVITSPSPLPVKPEVRASTFSWSSFGEDQLVEPPSSSVVPLNFGGTISQPLSGPPQLYPFSALHYAIRKLTPLLQRSDP